MPVKWSAKDSLSNSNWKRLSDSVRWLCSHSVVRSIVVINRIDQISSGRFHIFKGQCHQDSALVENLARIFIPVEIAKNDCLYEEGKLHVWKKSFFGYQRERRPYTQHVS